MVVTVGATEAISCGILSIVDPGDEVIVVEPFFDNYKPQVESCGGVLRYVQLTPRKRSNPLSSSDWVLDFDQLESTMNKITKLIVLNTPNNPLGKVFTRNELERIGALCKKYDVIALSDEVYEFLDFPGHEHVRIASLPGMWERTLTIGSAGKAFAATGWRLGWLIGPSDLIDNAMAIHQNTVFHPPTILQEAAARSVELETRRLGEPDSFFEQHRKELLEKRERMANIIRLAGWEPIIPDGGFFMMADVSASAFKPDLKSNETVDYQFSKLLITKHGLTAIPPSFFYGPEHMRGEVPSSHMRFCFGRKSETLDRAEAAVRGWNESRKQNSSSS